MATATEKTQIVIHHYADILCVWAYIADIRIQELKARFGDDIELDFHTLPIFGNVPGKMQAQWGGRGGVAGYAEHVRDTAARFEHVQVSSDVWVKNTPQSSLPAHLVLSALKVAARRQRAAPDCYQTFSRRVRQAFFVETQDVGSRAVLQALLRECIGDTAPIDALIDNGEAHAQLAEDMQLAKEHDVRSSPTLLFNDGRQRLTGNVGYRIVEANIRELIERPHAQHSWC